MEKRSSIMSSVRSKNTKPEMYVRSMLHNNGLRFRLHSKNLPGSPDIVLSRLKTAIFVNGCFWHGHNCPKGRRPASNLDFWNEKLDQNLRRDEENHASLREMGWRVIVIWECEIVNTTEKIVGELRLAKQPHRRKRTQRDNVCRS